MTSPEAVAPRPVPVRPMNIGDLLDGAVRLFVSNWQAVLLVVAVVVVPVEILASFLQRDAFQLGFFDLLRDPAALDAAAAGAAPLAFGAPEMGGIALSTLVALLVLPVLTGAVSLVVAGSYVGDPMPWNAALRTAGGRAGTFIGAAFLVHIVQFLLFIPAIAVFIAAAVLESLWLVVVGLVVVLATVVVVLVVSALLTATAPAIAVERIGVVAGMRRSWALRRPRLWPTVGAVLVAGLLAAVVGQAVTGVPGLLALGFGGPFAWLAAAVATILAQLIQLPFLTIFSTLLYFDGRIRREGLDLQMMAGDLGS